MAASTSSSLQGSRPCFPSLSARGSCSVMCRFSGGKAVLDAQKVEASLDDGLVLDSSSPKFEVVSISLVLALLACFLCSPKLAGAAQSHLLLSSM